MSTAQLEQPPVTGAGGHRPQRWTALATAAVVMATALVLLDAPVTLRTLVALPILTLVTGAGLMRMILGPATDTDPLLRCGFAVACALLALITITIAIAGAQLPIGTTSVALGTAGVALVTILVDHRRTADRPGQDLPAVVRRAGAVLVSVLVLAAAVWGASALIPPRVEIYSVATFADGSPAASGPIAVLRGQPVTLEVIMRYFGEQPTAAPTATVVVGGSPARDVAITSGSLVDGELAGAGPDWRRTPGIDDGGQGDPPSASQRSTITLTAPTKRGYYALTLTVAAGSDSQLLTTYVEVQ